MSALWFSRQDSFHCGSKSLQYSNFAVRTTRPLPQSLVFCRPQFFWNLRWRTLERNSSVEALFIDTSVGFEKLYLEFMDPIQFHGCASGLAVARATEQTLCPSTTMRVLKDDYNDARMLRLVMEVTEEMSGTGAAIRPVILREELDETFVQCYDEWVHRIKFDRQGGDKSRELVGDGHFKIISKLCHGQPAPKRAGKPSIKKSPKRMEHGWFVVCSPLTGGSSQRIA